MRALVTGSSGFIGSHIVDELDERGWDVTSIDLVNHQDALWFFQSDRTGYDLAFHCAARIGSISKRQRSPLSVATNLALDSWFLRWLELSHTDRGIYFSSCAAHPVDSMYGYTKQVGEKLVEAYNGICHVFRPYSGYGATQSLDYPYPSLLQRARNREDPFEIWGDGTQVRDFVHVDDIVAAVFKAIELDITEPVELGTGRGTSMLELAQMMCKAAGYSPEFKFLENMPGGTSRRVCKQPPWFYTPRVSLEESIGKDLA